MNVLDGYERVTIQEVTSKIVFLYVLHYTEANSLHLGFGIESTSGLQKAHLSGPNIHAEHAPLLADWLREGGQIEIVEDKAPRVHPFSSTMKADESFDYPAMLAQEEVMYLSAGRYMPFVIDAQVTPGVAARYAELIDKVRYKAFGHPLDWDIQRTDLGDGRFVWYAYDNDLGPDGKIRIGLGFYDEANQPQYGRHAYAIGRDLIGPLIAYHFRYADAPLGFMGLPPRWPFRQSTFVAGLEKQRFVIDLMRLADRAWPGLNLGKGS